MKKKLKKRFGKGITDSFPNYQSFFGDFVKYDWGYDAPLSITSEFKKDGKVVKFVTTWDKSFKNVKHKESFIDKRSPNSTVHTLKNGKIQMHEAFLEEARAVKKFKAPKNLSGTMRPQWEKAIDAHYAYIKKTFGQKALEDANIGWASSEDGIMSKVWDKHNNIHYVETSWDPKTFTNIKHDHN